MKIISDAATAAKLAGTCIASAAVKIAGSPPMRVWGGYGQISLAGELYDGVGDRGLVTLSGAALGDSEQNITLTLSGVEPDVVALLDADSVKDAPCQIWLLDFDGSGQTLLDARICRSGRIDTLLIEETVGSTSTIVVNVETQARGLGRSGQRMRTDADQRLIDPADAAYHVVSFAGNKTLYWGGQRPSSASSLGSSSSPMGLEAWAQI